jgi:hypothetical protein
MDLGYVVRRSVKRKGQREDLPAPSPPPERARRSRFECEGMVVKSFTRSEARSLFKGMLNIPRNGRLPVGIDIKKTA